MKLKDMTLGEFSKFSQKDCDCCKLYKAYGKADLICGFCTELFYLRDTIDELLEMEM